MKTNQFLTNLNNSYLYSFHLTLNDKTKHLFSGINYVCMQGSAERAFELSLKLRSKIFGLDNKLTIPNNLSLSSKFAIYKVGNILSVSHGMGNPSIGSLLNELTKLLHFAGNTNLEYYRIGTSGGIGIEPGTVVVTKQAFDPELNSFYTFQILDKQLNVDTKFDINLTKRIVEAQTNCNYPIICGNTIAADDFYSGQARYDGAIAPSYTIAQRHKYFKKIAALGIVNFEMESTMLAAFCNLIEIPAAMIAVALINRKETDSISTPKEQLAEFADRAHYAIINYLKFRINLQ